MRKIRVKERKELENKHGFDDAISVEPTLAGEDKLDVLLPGGTFIKGCPPQKILADRSLYKKAVGF